MTSCGSCGDHHALICPNCLTEADESNYCGGCGRTLSDPEPNGREGTVSFPVSPATGEELASPDAVRPAYLRPAVTGSESGSLSVGARGGR